jgi:hypothetical protein
MHVCICVVKCIYVYMHIYTDIQMFRRIRKFIYLNVIYIYIRMQSYIKYHIHLPVYSKPATAILLSIMGSKSANVCPLAAAHMIDKIAIPMILKAVYIIIKLLIGDDDNYIFIYKYMYTYIHFFIYVYL